MGSASELRVSLALCVPTFDESDEKFAIGMVCFLSRQVSSF